MTPLMPQPVAAAWNVADRAIGGAACHDPAPAGVDTVISAGLVVELPAAGTVVVTAVGEIDAQTAAALSCCLHRAIDNRSAGIGLDLIAVRLFDDAGLRIMVCAADHARAHTVSSAIVCNEPLLGYSEISAVVTVPAAACESTN